MTISLSDQFAFGTHKVPPKKLANPEERRKRNEHMLCRALNLRTVVAFVGAGCSAAFGYPTWEEFASAMIELTSDLVPQKHQTLLERFRTVLPSSRRRSDRLTLIIEVCKSILTEEGILQSYKDTVKTLFSLRTDGDQSSPQHNPYLELFGLKIRRFVTTNYDVELERNLIRERNLHSDDKELEYLCAGDKAGRTGLLRSFSQNTHDYEQLALFALAKVRGNENAVFHCHGRFDDPDSLIASETDYQGWYFSEKEERRTFRQTVELLLESNPLLFVGYSLHDDELLRPLRHLNALDPMRKHARPLFALVEWTPEDEVDDEVLYERYGVHVIPYDVVPQAGNTERSKALCAKLGAIKDLWKCDLREWTEKPKARTPGVGGDPASRTYVDNIRPTNVPVGQIVGRDGEIKEIDEEIKKPGLIGIRGPGGSGKSLHLLRLIGRCAGQFERCYYWNAHYGSEFLTAFDNALAFFDAVPNLRESRNASMRRLLRERRLLLIFDGCERFLHRTRVPGRVESYSSAFNLLLKQLCDPEMKSTVILSGRLLPAELTAAESGGGPQRMIRITRVVTADLHEMPMFTAAVANQAGRASLSALCSLLRGHSYGLCLADHYLTLEPDEKKRPARLEILLQVLADRSPEQRLSAMVGEFVSALDGSRSGPVRAFLERMARFVGPVCRETCEVCYQAAVNRSARSKAGVLLDQLLEHELIFEMFRSGTSEVGYCVHATARGVLLQPRHGLAPDSLPDFGLSGFTSGRIDVDPDMERRPQIAELFNDLMERGEELVQKPGRGPAAADLCVDAFALLRGTMATNTAPRWCTYDSYCTFGIRLVRLVKAVCVTASLGGGVTGVPTRDTAGTWSYCEYFDRDLIESPAAPLHISELAWLYNDIGLALSAEGMLSDAYSVWEQAFEISRTMEHPDPGGGYRVEVLFNLTHVLIEMGRLRAARKYLEAAEEFNAKLQGKDFAGRILGFRGLLAHLSGNLPEADVLYKKCAKTLGDGNNLRAQSVFLKHHADLKMSMGELDQAELLIRASRALAEAGVFPDLVAFARVSHGHLLAYRKQYRASRQEYQSLLQEAQRMGARKLEAECQSTLSRLCLQEGDVEGSRVRAMKAMSLANELSLGLRLTHSMVVLGLSTIKAGQRGLGVAYLRNARQLASEQEYWHCRWQAQTALQELGEV